MQDVRTPLGRVRGLGSAKEGVQHWWVQRLTALALVPLSLWFIYSMIRLTGAEHSIVVAWFGHTLNAVLMIVLIATTFHHAQLGLQVVIEDYVHHEGRKLASIITIKFLAVLLAAAAIFGVLRIALGVNS